VLAAIGTFSSRPLIQVKNCRLYVVKEYLTIGFTPLLKRQARGGRSSRAAAASVNLMLVKKLPEWG